METLAVALFLATANKAIIDYLAQPVRQRYPDADLWWLVYVALATGAAVSWLAGINLFGDYVASVVAGQVLTAVLVGGGSSLIHDVFSATGPEVSGE